MTLGPHLDPVGQVDQVVRPFFQARVQVEEVGMEVEAEWEEAWASWEGQVVASLEEDHRSALHPMLDLTTSWVLEECLALEVAVVEAVEEEEEEVDFPQVVLVNSICHQTSVHQCTLGQVSTPCCHQEVWEVLEEEGHPTLDLVCLHSSSMDRVDTRSIAHHYLEVEAQEGPRMAPYLPWEEAWVLQ